jgi:hypothetical protein
MPPETGATPSAEPSIERDTAIFHDALRGIREIFRRNGEKLETAEEEAIVRSVPAPEEPSLPFFILYASVCKDLLDFTLVELTGVGYVIVVILSWMLWVVLFFWFLGKINGTWWKGILIKRLWLWLVLVLVVESVPLLKIVPTNTILVLMAHYREKKMVKLITLAMELWHKYEIPLRGHGDATTHTGPTPHPHPHAPGVVGGTPPNAPGATPFHRPSRADAWREHPVIASQQEHFADPLSPRGATPIPHTIKAAPALRRPKRILESLDEEAATLIRKPEVRRVLDVVLPGLSESPEPLRKIAQTLGTGISHASGATPAPHTTPPNPGAGLRDVQSSPRPQTEPRMSPEQKRDAVREASQETRGTILKDVLSWETVSNGANLIPLAGGGKMLLEAIAGKEAHGVKLSGKERIIHTSVGVGSLALDLTGIGEAGKGVIIVGKSVGLIEKIGVKLTQKGAVKSAQVFSKAAKFMAEHPELTKKGEEYAEARIQDAVRDMKNYQEGARPKPQQDDTMTP